MIGDPSPDAKTSARFAETPWTEHSEPWRELDEKLPHDHLAREMRDAMIHLDLTPSTAPITVWAKPLTDRI